MQNTEGKEKWCEWLRGKGKPLQSIYNLMHGLEQVIQKGVMQKQTMGKWQ